MTFIQYSLEADAFHMVQVCAHLGNNRTRAEDGPIHSSAKVVLKLTDEEQYEQCATVTVERKVSLRW